MSMPVLVTQKLWPEDEYCPEAWKIRPHWQQELWAERWAEIHQAALRGWRVHVVDIKPNQDPDYAPPGPYPDYRGQLCLTRSSVEYRRSMRDWVEHANGRPVECNSRWTHPADEYVMWWPHYAAWSGRRLQAMPIQWVMKDGHFDWDVLRAFSDQDGNVFVKSTEKGVAAVLGPKAIVTLESVERCFMELLDGDPGAGCIVSEYLDLELDYDGSPREWRAWVCGGVIVNKTHWCDDRDLVLFAHQVAHDNRAMLPWQYAVDLARTTDGQPVVIEFNPIISSGRYEYNDLERWLLYIEERAKELACARTKS